MSATREHIELPIDGHDLRVVREPHRARAEQARRRQRQRQLRHREGERRVRRGGGRPRPSSSRRSRPSATAPSCPPRSADGRAPDEDDRIRPPRCAPPDRLGRAVAAGAPRSRWCRRCSSTTGSGSRSTWRPRSCSGARWPFHRAAWANLKHGAATMDTLVSVGVLAAWLWSLYALFIGDAGMPGMRMDFDLIPDAGAGRRRDLSRDGVRRHDLHPRRALFRGTRQAPRRRRAQGAARARRQGRRGPRRRRQRAPRARRRAAGRRPLRRASRREGGHRRHRRGGQPRPST